MELTKGKLEGCVLTCPVHEWQYDARTGEGVNPQGVRLPTFPVCLEDGGVFVEVGAEADERTWVGPVLRRVASAQAIIDALLEENAHAKLVDRGSYVRVVAPRRCRLSREVVERHAHTRFHLPSDLELVMASFKGRLTISEDDVVWECAEKP